MRLLIKNAKLVNQGKSFYSDLLIEGKIIKKIAPKIHENADRVIDAKGLHLLPGWIDDQVHFREPGLTHKATIASESRAAVAGGITSFLEMPNTIPQTTDSDALLDKHAIAEKSSIAILIITLKSLFHLIRIYISFLSSLGQIAGDLHGNSFKS